MFPLEIHIPLKIEDCEPIGVRIEEESTIKVKITEGGGSIYPIYDGPTVVTPLVHESVELETRNKALLENVIVEEIPYYETTNPKGTTFIIGG